MDHVDDEAREIETQIANRVLAEIPDTYEELVVTWETKHRLPAQSHPSAPPHTPREPRKRAFDPGRFEIVPKA